MINEVDEYKRVLLAILRAHTSTALSMLQSINRCLPEKTRSVRIMVHVPQDAEGMFSVVVHLDGPDLFVLNKAIGDFRYLFDVRVVNGAITPDVPLFDPFDQPFSVNDAIVDIAMVWVKELWATFGGMKVHLPVTIEGEDGFGSTPTISLTV
ncbi:DUF6389 family protein [Paracoccus aerodenitrificans]|uniref:DUF6389 family protein n=1 Tax=Paracoccus aerodenitrificans TaxID=3017781 RepID=UPI0022F10019|nr:DUF6389 family protein [Paracoccus aerodenitrificans]WBU64592.1 DUF6389 family protein [Paracoccus aerodenitrificans]